MALSSQTLNNGVRSQFMTSRRRRRKRPTGWIVGLTLVALAMLTVWWVWPDSTRRPDEGPATDPLVAAAPVEADRPNPRRESVAPASSPRADSRPAIATPAPERGPRTDGLVPDTMVSAEGDREETAEAIDGAIDMTIDEQANGETESDAVGNPVGLAAESGLVPSPPKVDLAPAAAGPLLSATESIPTRDSAAAPPNRDEVATLSVLADRDPIRVREELTELVVSGSLTASQERNARETLNRINGRLLFSPHVQADDPFIRTYSVQPGDSLERIARRELAGGPDWRFVQRINGIRNPRGLQINQRLKLPVGTFHAVVDKSEFRMDLFLVDGGRRVLVASYPVGLGELNSTPEGVAKVRKGSKLIDPEWYNPRTSEYFAADDPKNPIGEHWIGLSSVESGDRLFDGYGIHGTIEPDSIGRSESMGCVRLLPEHVAVVYEMLTEPDSTVEVRP
ncbi:MAG: L,D-transpeptidase family protein [Planctomycetota bacterium]|jgi:nucleoid-associated protein YgaU